MDILAQGLELLMVNSCYECMPQAAVEQWLALLNRVEAEQAGRWPVEDQARIHLARGCLCRAQKQDAGSDPNYFWFWCIISWVVDVLLAVFFLLLVCTIPWFVLVSFLDLCVS